MVERRPLRALNGNAPHAPRRRRTARPTTFQEGNKRGKGRPPGSPNRLPAAVKEAIRMGAELVGDHSGVSTKARPRGELLGVGGAELYFAELARNHKALYVELVKATLPKVIEGADGGPAYVLTIPPQLIPRMTPEQTRVYEQILKLVDRSTPPQLALADPRDASAFAKEIDYEEIDNDD